MKNTVLSDQNQNNINVVLQAPYSPDMKRFFFFPYTKLDFQGKCFDWIKLHS